MTIKKLAELLLIRALQKRLNNTYNGLAISLKSAQPITIATILLRIQILTPRTL